MQSDVDAQRIVLLGADPGKVRVTGNMKYDLGVEPASASARETLVRRLGFTGGERIIVAGSTHSGEEDIVLAAFRHLSAEFPAIRLILAPRHPQRGEEVALLVRKAGFEPVRLSAPEVKPHAGRPTVHILDTVGQLMAYYGIAEIVFVGGSLVNTGGHNILEPAALGKAVVCGYSMHNFREVAEQFRRAGAVVQVRDQAQLVVALRELLADTEKRRRLGEKAASIIAASSGATRHTLSFIKQVLETRES
jgi:3-deoxy-D-manno-octulosonic-acid transferase